MLEIPSITILGVRVHAITTAQTLQWVQAAIAHRQPRQICTANPEFLMAAQSDPEFFTLLNQADLVLPDGMGLLFAARWLGGHLPERVAGSDLIYQLAEQAALHGWRLFLLGAAEGVAQAAAEVLQKRYTGLCVAGTWAGSPHLVDDAEALARIHAAQPDVVLVAYGAPAQDKWIRRNVQQMRVPVSMGVGGSFDFVAGVVPRAPVWVQRLALEWLYRLYRQPWRWRRIATATIAFPWAVWRFGRNMRK